MNILNDWKPIKLRAIDDSDLLVFSECIYEAIVLPSEINYDINQKRFAMAIERFTWEKANGKDYNLMQVLSILVVYGVQKLDTKDFKRTSHFSNLRSISYIDNNILILLNNEKIINLKVKKWSCTLEDIGIPTYPPTTPSHFKNE